MSSSSPAPSCKSSQQVLEGGRLSGRGLRLSKYGGVTIRAAMRLVTDVAVGEPFCVPMGELMPGLEPSLWSVIGALCRVGRYLSVRTAKCYRKKSLSFKIQAKRSCSVALPKLWLGTEPQNSMILLEISIRVTCGSAFLFLPGVPEPSPSDQEEHWESRLHEISLSNSVPLFFCVPDAQALWNVKH